MLRFGSGPAFGRALILILLAAFLSSLALAGDGTGKKRKKNRNAAASPSPAEQGLTNIPLPIGQEAKGVVIPDFDMQGSLRDRFEAGTAKRLDENHIQLRDLKMTTYTPDQKNDLHIAMSDSVLNLKTRVIASQERTTVRRSDFRIEGDSMQFDTNTRQGTLVGNVKMVITGQSDLIPKQKAK
jgi:lipopolysaccharide assembly outer membrane protein LptD (OstA)